MSFRLGPEEEADYKRTFPGSHHQRVLHSFLTTQIEAVRTELETVDPTKLAAAQAKVATHRMLLEVLHQHDPNHVTKTYEE